MGQLTDIQTARRDIRGNQHPDFPFFKAVERILPVNLGFIAMNGIRTHTGTAQLTGNLVRTGLGTHKYQCTIQLRVTQGIQQQLFLVFPIDKIHRLVNGLHGGGYRIDLYPGKILLEQPLDQGLYRFGHGSGKQQGLHFMLTHALDDAFHIINEAHIQHTVGFIQNKQFNVLQINIALSAQVIQPSRRCHQHIHSGAEGLGLVILGYTAIDQCTADIRILCIGQEAVINLDGQLTGGGENQGTDGRKARQPFFIF